MKEPVWILKTVVLRIHDAQIAEHGGSPGLRDESLLESALHQPQHLFSYSTSSIFELATAYAERIIKNHPFIDGNKRTAYVIVRLFLALNGYRLTAPKEEEGMNFVHLAANKMTASDFSSWLKNNAKAINRP